LLAVRKEIEKHIKRLVKPLKEDEALKAALKAKLTKKELKLLNAWSKEREIKVLQKQLNLDHERYEELSAKLIRKLNQEKLKQAISI